MKLTIIVALILSTTTMAEAQIKNVIERNGQAIIELEDEYRSGSSPWISLNESILAGWNNRIVVVIHHRNSNGGQARIYDYNGNAKRDSDLGMISMSDAKVTVTSNGIVVNVNGNTFQYDLNGKRK